MKDDLWWADIYWTLNDRKIQKDNLQPCNNGKIKALNDNVLKDINMLVDEKDEIWWADIYWKFNDI